MSSYLQTVVFLCQSLFSAVVHTVTHLYCMLIVRQVFSRSTDKLKRLTAYTVFMKVLRVYSKMLQFTIYSC